MKRVRSSAVELIEQVRQRACLWDRACAAYRLRPAKDAAWRELVRTLHPHYDHMSPTDQQQMVIVIMRKWYNIRDAFKKYSSRSGSGGRPYVYADLLTFLLPVFEQRVPREPQHTREEEDVDKEEWLSVFDLEHSSPSPAPSPSPSPSPSPAKRAKPDLEYRPKGTEPDDILSVLVSLIDKEDDEDRAFFRSITPTVKALPEDDKFLFRIQVMKLLDKLRKKTLVKLEVDSEGSDTE